MYLSGGRRGRDGPALCTDLVRVKEDETPMAWKRRRPSWPYLAILCFLFALALLAPESWRRRHDDAIERAPIGLPAEHAVATDAALPVEPEAAAPALPPLAFTGPRIGPPTFAEPELAEPMPAGPAVASDDYVAVDEPLVEPTPLVEDPVTTEPPMPVVESPPSAVAESFASRPGGRSVLVRNVPAPTTPSRPPLTVETVIRVRDALLSWFEEARAAQAAAAAAAPAPRPALPRVMVESSDDRLAMVPELADPTPAPMPAPFETAALEPTPTLAPEPEFAAGPDLAPMPAALVHRPTNLIDQLNSLQPGTPGAAWAADVLARLEPLTAEPAPAVESRQPTLAELRLLAQQGAAAAVQVADPAEQSAWIRAALALDRRLPVWELLLDPRAAELVDRPAPPADEAALMESLHEVATLTAGSEEGAKWRDYLRLDDLAGLTSVGGDDYVEVRRATARDVLIRTADPRLSADQRSFLEQPPLAALEQRLHPWASGAVSLDALAALVERYEGAPTQRDADAIAELRLRMKWSGDSRLEGLAEDVNRHYRNGNARLALSQDFFNRLIPEQPPVVAPVNDKVTGAEVHGRSRTQTKARLVLLPDPTVWRFGLEVQGAVKSKTYSDVGAARVRNASSMQYDVRKLIVVNRYGMHVWPSEAKVRGRNSLVGIESHLGPVPVVGNIIDGLIRESHRQNEPAAMAQVKSKVGRQARQRMDREADEKLANLEDRLGAIVTGPLARFALTVEPLEMTTSEERAAMRVRLASDQQLAAHTPRPSAPSDSLVSLQLHESAFNNAAEGLGLDGRRITVGELHTLLAEKITRVASAPPDDLPQRAIVEFAKHDAVQIQCREDRIELVLNIVELRKGRDSIRNVGVHAFFRPVIDGLEVKLVREGTLQFEGAHLRTGPRLVLHSVFGKMIRKDQEVSLLAAKINDDPRFAGMMVTQLVIDDGWTALSLGPAAPNRTAWRTRTSAAK